MVASQAFSLVVQAALSITTTSLANATSGTAYSTTLAATGGQSPYKWSLASGTLPTGMTLNTSGVLAGPPSQNGTFNFTVSATDSEAILWVASLPLSLLVSPPLSAVLIVERMRCGAVSERVNEFETGSVRV